VVETKAGQKRTQKERQNMENQFDELTTKNLAQSVTRCAALRKFGVCLAGMALARFGLNNAQAITNGQLDGDAHPNVGGLVWLVSPLPGVSAPLVGGSGSLIHPRVFLTAGHVTYAVQNMVAQGAMTLDDLLVSFAPDVYTTGTQQRFSGVLTHPGYAPNASSSEDVGVLILSEAITSVASVPLPPAGFLDALAAAGQLKTTSNRTGFGVVGYGVDPGDANYGHLPFPPDGLRRIAQPEFQNLHDRWLCTDQNDSRDLGGSCTGDSGGPLFWVDPVTAQETLVAICSWGTLTTAHGYRVDTGIALDFLNAVIARVEAGQL
jgi:hypothetical protein